MSMAEVSLHHYTCLHTVQLLVTSIDFLTNKIKSIALELKPATELPIVCSGHRIKSLLNIPENCEISKSLLRNINCFVRQTVEMLVYYFFSTRMDLLGNPPQISTNTIIKAFLFHRNVEIKYVDFDSFNQNVGIVYISDIDSQELIKY